MSSVFTGISKQPRRSVVTWAAQSFAGGNTFRMFQKGGSKKIREFLRTQIRDCAALASARDQQEYDRKLVRLIERFRATVRMNARTKRKKPNFGQGAKIVNLYIKQFLLAPDFMGNKRAKRLYRFAHVPLDRYVLGKVWDDFQGKLTKHKLGRPKLNRLDLKTYRSIQRIIREEARHFRYPALAYDFAWPERNAD